MLGNHPYLLWSLKILFHDTDYIYLLQLAPSEFGVFLYGCVCSTQDSAHLFRCWFGNTLDYLAFLCMYTWKSNRITHSAWDSYRMIDSETLCLCLCLCLSDPHPGHHNVPSLSFLCLKTLHLKNFFWGGYFFRRESRSTNMRMQGGERILREQGKRTGRCGNTCCDPRTSSRNALGEIHCWCTTISPIDSVRQVFNTRKVRFRQYGKDFWVRFVPAFPLNL